jgi:hypothetical protein
MVQGLDNVHGTTFKVRFTNIGQYMYNDKDEHEHEDEDEDEQRIGPQSHA